MSENLMDPITGLSESALQEATAIASNVLSGKTFYAGDKTLKTGSMINRGAWSSSINAESSIIIPAGYHNGSGKVTASGSSMRIDDYISDYIHSTAFPILKATATITCGSKKVTSQTLISHQAILSRAICSSLFSVIYDGAFLIYANGSIYASINGSSYRQYSNGAYLLSIGDTSSGRISAYQNL